MKSFYVVSALLSDSTQLGNLTKWKTEKEAIDRAKEVIELRRAQGSSDIDFYILKVTAKVGAETPPIKITKLK